MIANASLFPQADSWYIGANAPGKPRAFLAYLGGVGQYRAVCDDVAAGGYAGFTVGPGVTLPDARTVRVCTGVELEYIDTGSPGLPMAAGDTAPDAGSRAPLVLICGTSHDMRLFGQLIPPLACGRRVTTYSHRGMGASTRDGRLGDCRLKTGMGDVHCEHTADLELATGAGQVDAERVSGRAVVASGSGTVRLGEVGGAAVVETSNGDCRVDAVSGGLRIVSGNGSIAVGRARAGVEARTGHGDIRIGEIVCDSVPIATGMGHLESASAPAPPPASTSAPVSAASSNTLEDAEGPARAERTVEVRARTGMGDVLVRRA